MIPYSDIQGRRYLVTGASSGIGRVTATLLSKLGARLTLVGRSEERLLETKQMLEGSEHVVEPMDLSQASKIPSWMKHIAKESGAFSGVVHSAGIQGVAPVRFLKDDDFTHMMNVNVNSAVQLAKGFRQKGVLGESGSLVFISSVVGIVGQAGIASYSASKGAINSLTRCLALEFAPESIRVNCVAPGIVNTEMTENLKSKLGDDQFQSARDMHPLGIGDPEDVANAVVFLLSRTAKWITGSTLVVDGGYTAK